MMAQMTLDYITNELFKDLKRPVNVLKLWRGPGIPPFDRRQEIYKKFEESGKIKTLEVLGPSNPADSEGSIATVVASILPKYPKGRVDVIWSAYDAYARGAYKALIEAKRTDIPIVSIDISNQDINLMRAKDGIWKVCVATHFENVGITGVRILAMKLNGDKTPDTYILSPSLIKASQLTPEANVTNLGTIVQGYGVNNDNLPDWMKQIQGKK
jgi:simple sugar transport system substrate-binding protein